MVINNFEQDFDELLRRSGKSVTEVGRASGIAEPLVRRTFKAVNVVTKGVVKVCEVMGYDLKVVYVKRGDK